MKHHRTSMLYFVAALALPCAFSALAGDVGEKRAKPDPIPWSGPVPKAHCGRWDWVESGLQGQTTPEERESGDSEGGYNCNLEFVGQFQGEGSKGWMMAWSDDCAYFGTNKNPLQRNLGTVVVDASDSGRPRASTYLDTP